MFFKKSFSKKQKEIAPLSYFQKNLKDKKKYDIKKLH